MATEIVLGNVLYATLFVFIALYLIISFVRNMTLEDIHEALLEIKAELKLNKRNR